MLRPLGRRSDMSLSLKDTKRPDSRESLANGLPSLLLCLIKYICTVCMWTRFYYMYVQYYYGRSRRVAEAKKQKKAKKRRWRDEDEDYEEARRREH